MHGSTSPSKNAWPSCSHRQFAATSEIVSRAAALAGSRPRSRSSISVGSVEVQGWPPEKSGAMPARQSSAMRRGKHAPPSHWPSGSRTASRLRSPALGLDPGALGGDQLGGRPGEVAQHLPPDRGITVKQPVDDVHGCDGRSRLPHRVTQDRPPPGAPDDGRSRAGDEGVVPHRTPPLHNRRYPGWRRPHDGRRHAMREAPAGASALGPGQPSNHVSRLGTTPGSSRARNPRRPRSWASRSPAAPCR